MSDGSENEVPRDGRVTGRLRLAPYLCAIAWALLVAFGLPGASMSGAERSGDDASATLARSQSAYAVAAADTAITVAVSGLALADADEPSAEPCESDPAASLRSSLSGREFRPLADAVDPVRGSPLPDRPPRRV